MGKTLQDLAQAIQNVGIDSRLPKIIYPDQFDEIRSSVLLLSGAIMDCLTAIIEYLNHSCCPRPLEALSDGS